MKQCFLFVLLFLLLPVSVSAEAWPQELYELADEADISVPEQPSGLVNTFLNQLSELSVRYRPEIVEQLRQGIRIAVLEVLIVLLAGLARGLHSGSAGEAIPSEARAAAVLALAALSLKEIGSLLPAATELLTELQGFSDALIPALGAAVAATGAVGTAAAQQVLTVGVSSALLRGMQTLLPPLVYAYIALITADAVLGDGRLRAPAESLHKLVSRCLRIFVGIFTVFLSLTHILSGSTDAMQLRLTKAALSGAVPIVGEMISESAETILAGAGAAKNGIGVFGLLLLISYCALPFLSLLFRYFACRVAVLACGVAEGEKLTEYLAAMSGAYALMLGMLGSAALFLFISIMAALAVVT